LSSTGRQPAFEQLTREGRLSDRVAKRLLDAIVSRGLSPGDPLPSERLLAEQFSVSRTVIREAVRSLAGKGIIDARPGRGLTVAAVDAADVTQALSLYLQGSSDMDYRKVHEVRAMLEVQIAGLAAERATAEEIKRLEGTCSRMAKAADDLTGAAREDLAFHRLLAESTHNELFDLLLDAVAAPLAEIRRETFRQEGRVEVALAAHREILECVAAGDATRARNRMRAHLIDVEHVWEQLAATDQTAGPKLRRVPPRRAGVRA